MKPTEAVKDLLLYHFQHHKSYYSPSEIVEVDQLSDIDVISKSGEKYQLNFDSDILNEEAEKMAVEMLSEIMPSDMVGAFGYLKKFEAELKRQYEVADYQSVYSDLIKGMKVHFLNQVNTGNSNYDFLLNLLDDDSERAKGFGNFEEVYFRFLLTSDYSKEIIYQSCTAVFQKNDKNARFIYNYLSNIAKNRSLAHNLYTYGMQNDILEYPGFASTILVGLYNSGDNSAFSIAAELVEADLLEGLKALSRFIIDDEETAQKIFAIISSISSELPGVMNQMSMAICEIINSEKSSDDLKIQCIHSIYELLKSEVLDGVSEVFHNARYHIDGHEAEKYQMLHIYLETTKNVNVLNDFFYQFKDPKYLFHFLTYLHLAEGVRSSIDRFDQAILHIYNENPIKTEAEILELFKYADTGLLAVKVMLSSHEHPLPIDVHKLDREEYQHNAIRQLCNYPHSLDKLLPTILKFRFSVFSDVKQHLQEQLSTLIFDAYHKSLYDLIESAVDARKERKFLAPLKKALAEYEKIKIFKAIKELDPIENERNLIDLYYRLEHESQAKLMNQREDRGGLSRLFKSVEIVRGRAWKTDGNDEVTPMALIQTSMMIDSRAYKNPVTYERNLENR